VNVFFYFWLVASLKVVAMNRKFPLTTNVELLMEIQKHMAHSLQSGLNLWVGSAGSTTIAARLHGVRP